MTTEDKPADERLIEAFQRREQRRASRRDFFRTGVGLAALSGLALSACDSGGGGGSPAPTPGGGGGGGGAGAIGDNEILNFALNLEYLEAQFYAFAAFGAGLPASSLGGQGTQGAVRGGRQVNFTDPVVAQYAREIARDEVAHVNFLRAALGTGAVAQPELDISADATGAFSSAARAAGLITAGQAFDPYANDENFLLAAYIFEDVGVTAYKGAAPLVTSAVYIEAAAGILAAEAYHAGLIRTVLYAKGLATPNLRTSADRISNARDSLDGASDLDQGITGTAEASNIVPLDANGLAFSRSGGQVLNIVFLTAQATDRGGFFPNGVNGAINRSAAS